MSVYFVSQCSICREYGMVIAILTTEGRVVAQCEECGKRYHAPQDIGLVGRGDTVPAPTDIARAASWDDIVKQGWDRVPWMHYEEDVRHYFP